MAASNEAATMQTPENYVEPKISRAALEFTYSSYQRIQLVFLPAY